MEVSEPIDFGSGDHQHLIRKAADKSIQSESGERYTPSSSAGPQETREKPRPKGTEQLNTYVVEISDDITPGDSNATLGNPFSDASVRRGENKEITFLEEKSTCSLKMFPQCRLPDIILFLVFLSPAFS